METNLRTFTCPCGYHKNGPDQLRGNFLVCESCRNTSYIDANSLYANSYVKYYPFVVSLDKFKQAAAICLIKHGPRDIFDNISDIEWRRVMIPMREFGSGNSRQAVCVAEYNLAEGLIAEKVSSSMYNHVFTSFDAINFSTDLLSSDLDTHNLPQYKEILPIAISDEVIGYEYNIASNSNYVIKYWPLFIMSFKYRGERYCVKAFGNFGSVNGLVLYSDIGQAKGKRLTMPKYNLQEDFASFASQKGVSKLGAVMLIVLPLYIFIAVLGFKLHFLEGVGRLITMGFWLGIFAAVLGVISNVIRRFFNNILAMIRCSVKGVVGYFRKKAFFKARSEQVAAAQKLFNTNLENYDGTY